MSEKDQQLSEQPVWEQVIGTWRLVHGSIQDLGASIEWHDFRLAQDFDWTKSFHPECLEICLNYLGQAEFSLRNQQSLLTENQLAWYLPGNSPVTAKRYADSLHRFFTLEVTQDFLERQFVGLTGQLKKPVQIFLRRRASFDSFVQIQSIPSTLLGMRSMLLEPPVLSVAEPLWYQGKILEILSHTLFEEQPVQELFCHKQHRLKRERVERVRYLLERDMENPPSLGDLAKAVECSPFYLSRIFAEETGVSIPKYLRMKRIEKAADLLANGKHNVTEAAMSVGYSSLSAFNKAFVEQIGVCPGLYGLPLQGGKNYLKRKPPGR
jgi:AraC-like DNA-binding protein